MGWSPRAPLVVAVLLTLVCAAPAALAAPAPLPPFDDWKAIRAYLDAAAPAARVAYYDAWLKGSAFDRGVATGLLPAFEKDLKELPDQRAAMAQAVVAAARRPEKARAKDEAGVVRWKYLDFGGVAGFVPPLLLHEESAAVLLKALPLPEGERSSIPAPRFEGPRAKVALAALGKIGAMLEAAAKTAIAQAALDWPRRLKDKGEDVASLRAVRDLLREGARPFFAAVADAAGILAGADMKALLAAAPTDAEVLELAAGLFGFKEAVTDGYSGGPVTVLALPGAAALRSAKPLADRLRAAKDPRAAALAALIDAAAAPPAAAEAARLLTAAVAAKDDWAATCLYRAAMLGKAILSDADLLACIDPARPCLAAAVLDDRWADAAGTELGAGLSVTLEGAGDFKEKAIAKCLLLKLPPEPRLSIPVLNALMFLGKADYVLKVFVNLKGLPGPVRNAAYNWLLRYASPAMYEYFAAGLSDPSDAVRLCSIKGIGAIRDPRGVDALARILGDTAEADYVRMAAANALGEIGDKRLASIMTAVLGVPPGKGGGDVDLREWAARGLGESRERAATGVLLANIDTSAWSELNYFCLEALGKIEESAAFAKLVPIVSKGIDAWVKGGAWRDNLYAAAWALFFYKSPDGLKVLEAIRTAGGKEYRDSTFIAAWALVRAAKEPDPALVAYLEANRGKFFGDYAKVYEFARMLEGRWDRPSLLHLASRLGDYSVAVQTWVLASMTRQPDMAFIPYITRPDPAVDRDVRNWTAHLVCAIAQGLPAPATSESIKSAKALRAIVEGWDEKDSSILSWLGSARTILAKHAPSEDPAGR